MKKILTTLFFSLVALFSVWGQSNLTPRQVLDRSVKAISENKGMELIFNVTTSGYTGKGEILTLGKKFKVKLPDVNIWYNGKDLYTYSGDTGETTVVIPTEEELAESNPLAYITGAEKNYNVSFSTVKKQGSYVLELIPAAKNANLKRVTLTVGKNNFIPERIVVEPKSGDPIRADILSYKKVSNVSSSEFEYPKSKYPKAEIVDLR